jgi:predicted anti-sigma-YlaC factor YlaD
MCEDVQAALSARLDGEHPGLEDTLVDGHVAGCPACVTWLARVRELPVPVVDPPPDLTDRIVAAVAADPVVAADRARRRAATEAYARRQVLRIAVAVAAVVQLALAVPVLVGAFLSTELGPHTGREMASFDVAVAVGFLLAAARPGRARAFVPVALVLAALLATTSGVDLARGVTTVGHEFGHLVAVVQAGLLWALGRIGTGTAAPLPRPREAR